jgi:hypothetical protein
MGPLAIAVVVGIAGWFGWRAFARERDRIARELNRDSRKANDATTLERDPKTGVYRTRDDRK